MTSSEMDPYLCPTPTIESEHSDIVAWARRHADGASDAREAAVQLYYAVRDGIRYDAYTADPTGEGLRASATLASGRGWCVSKAILLAACCRSIEIPARLGFADVRNHLSTARMRAHMQTDVFYWHGYTSIHLEGRFLKATPAFNVELCEKFGLRPLEFDGREDSIYHPFDLEGNRHMEYVNERGEFADVPIDAILETFQTYYPGHMQADWGGDFDSEVDAETAVR